MMYDYEIRTHSTSAYRGYSGVDEWGDPRPTTASPTPPQPNGNIQIVRGANFDFIYAGAGDGAYPTGLTVLDEEGNRVWAMFSLPISIKRLEPVEAVQ